MAMAKSHRAAGFITIKIAEGITMSNKVSIQFQHIIKSSSDQEFAVYIKNNPDSACASENGVFPEVDSFLYHALRLNHVNKMKCLFKAGATIDLLEKDLMSALFVVWGNCSNKQQKQNQKESVDLLLEQGLNLSIDALEDSAIPHACGILDRLSSTNNIEVFDLILSKGFDPLALEKRSYERPFGGSLIVSALINPHYQNEFNRSNKLAEMLVELGCEFDHPTYEESPLQEAMKCNAMNVVDALLNKGLNTDKYLGEGLIVDIARNKKLPIALFERIMCDEMKGNALTGTTLLHEAFKTNNKKLIEHLLSQGWDINTVDQNNETLLFLTIDEDRKNKIDKLIEKGIDLNVVNNKNKTVLDIATKTAGFKRICSSLVKSGAKTYLEVSSELSGPEKTGAVIKSITAQVHSGEPWADQMIKSLSGEAENDLVLWSKFITLCFKSSGTKPSKTWLKDAASHVDAIGVERYSALLIDWLSLVKEKRTEKIDESEVGLNYEYSGREYAIAENNVTIIKCLLWSAGALSNRDLAKCIREIAQVMYKKVPGVGMRNAKIANAAIYCLSEMPNDLGVKDLIVLRSTTKYNAALVNINRVFDKVAKDKGLTADELAQVATPDYGLTGIGKYEVTIGQYLVKLEILPHGKTLLTWTGNDKTQKSVPASIKNSHKVDIKKIKTLEKEIKVATSAASARIEKLYLSPVSLDVETWKKQYLEHSLVGFVARRLVWRIKHKGGDLDVLYHEGRYIDFNDNDVVVPNDADVCLWHPAMASTQDVLAWRKLSQKANLTQPFKQVHREIYILTDAEKETSTYSNRFASHIINHQVFHALCEQRGWSQTRGGSWDGGHECGASKNISASKVGVHLDATGNDHFGFSAAGIFSYVATGSLNFYQDGKSIKMENLDSIVFSEFMRDVDLFVGVCSIGNDPSWQEREGYWHQYSFGALSEIAETRKSVLSDLILKLKKSDKFSIEGKFLLVQGSLAKYKIHIGSSNILIEPDDRYLCIVQGKKGDEILLPFEGDTSLSLILSKAMMLVNDDKIKDQSIISQITTREAL